MVQPRKLPPDYHTHTHLCKHAMGVPADYLASARAQGLPHLATTDHCPTDDGFGIEHRMALVEFDIYRRWVDETQAAGGSDLLFGIEADYYRGCEPFLAPFLEKAGFDVVLGSVHFLDFWSPDPSRRGLAGSRHPEEVWREYFVRITEMAGTGLYDIAAHLDLPKKFGNPIETGLLREFALPALDALAEAGMCLEINTSGARHPQKSFYPSLEILAWAAERGIGLTFGSDAHDPLRVASDFDTAVALARQAGFTESVHFRQRKATRVPLP